MQGFAALAATAAEYGGALAIAIGVLTRPAALLGALYTLGTARIGRVLRAEEGAARYGDATNFYKHISMMGGVLLVYVAGPERYPLDGWLRKANA